MRLKSKITFLILPVILLQIVVLIVPSFIFYQQYFSGKIKVQISDSIAQVQNSVRLQVKTMQADSLLFSKSKVLNRYLRTEDENIRFNLMHRPVLDEFTTFMDAHPEYIEISLLALDGYEEVALHNDAISNLSDEEQDTFYFKNIRESPFDVEMTPLINPDTKQWVLVLARKIFQKNVIEQSVSSKKQIKGYLIVKIDFDFLDHTSSSNSLLDHGFMIIHDSKGAPIVVKGTNKLTSDSLFKIFAAMTSNNELQITDWSLNGKEYIIGQKVMLNGLVGSFGWSRSELSPLLKKIGYTSLLNSLLVIIVSGVILFSVLNKQLINPILKLGIAAKKMGQGELWSFQSQSSDELGTLSDTIKEMGQSLFEQKQKIHEIAFTDSLTKLPNRRQFTDYLDQQYQSFKDERPDIALLFIDLDGFKQINDNYGHHAGDQLLVAVAKRLKKTLRTGDSVNYGADKLLARLGGDEFTVLLKNIRDRYAAEQVAQRILDAFTHTFSIDNREFLIGASIGIAVASENSESAVDLLRNADTAMYEAKKEGKNTYRFFSKTAALKSLRVIEMKEALRKAINHNELELAYQPQICTKTREMVSCEALVRWNQPGKGWIPPDVFIPIAEESGLILSLSRWVLLEACHQIKQWQLMGYPISTVWVNISCVQLAKEDMHKVIMDCLLESGLSAEFLAIEVTESSIMQGPDSLRQLEKLQLDGIKVALDDFGTGYSSLSALRGLPIDKLKIDKSFITDLNSGVDGEAIVAAIIAMAHQLNLQVVAEGVETAEELDFLEQKEVEIIQGYYFSKPLLSDSFMERLQSSKTQDDKL